MRLKRFNKNIKKYIKAASAALALCLLYLMAEPMTVSAAVLGEGAFQMAGVTSMLNSSLTEEDYMQIAEAAKGAAWGYTNIGISNVEKGGLNVRENPDINSKVVGRMGMNAACEVVELLDGWAHIQSGKVEGYVSLDYLLIGPEATRRANEVVHTVVISNVNGLNVRDEASRSGSIMTTVICAEELEFVEDLGEWIKVSLDGEDAYVASEYVTVKDKLDTAISISEIIYGVDVSDTRVELVEYAKQFLGNPYVWGGTSLTKGADCSGFVLSIFKQYGVKLSHSSRAQANEGTKIKESELLPGDLVFYTNGKGTINHVALYIGGGQVIHASNPKTGIRINNYNYRTPAKFVRVLDD